MHLSTFVLSAVAAGVASAQQTSICDKYTTALLKDNTAKNQYTLLTLLVNTAALGNFTGPGTTNPTLPGSKVNVPGILAPGQIEGEAVNLAPYFSGALSSTNRGNKAVSVNFLDGGGAQPIIANPTSAGNPGSNQERLFKSLYSYFGKLLACSGYDSPDFPAYKGQASQYKVHQFMNLDHAQNSWFIQNVGLAAKSFGATDDDIATVAMTLQNTFNYKCSPAAEIIPGQGAQLQSICSNATCPLDPKSTCPAYPAGGTGTNPLPAAGASSSSGGSGSGSSSAGAASPASTPVSQISDKQPQAATTAAAPVSQISDNQPQAPTSAAVTQISDHQPQAPTSAGTPAATPMYTGAAVANRVPALLGGVVGLVAFGL